MQRSWYVQNYESPHAYKLAKHTLHTQAKYDRRIARLCIIYILKLQAVIIIRGRRYNYCILCNYSDRLAANFVADMYHTDLARDRSENSGANLILFIC